MSNLLTAVFPTGASFFMHWRSFFCTPSFLVSTVYYIVIRATTVVHCVAVFYTYNVEHWVERWWRGRLSQKTNGNTKPRHTVESKSTSDIWLDTILSSVPSSALLVLSDHRSINQYKTFTRNDWLTRYAVGTLYRVQGSRFFQYRHVIREWPIYHKVMNCQWRIYRTLFSGVVLLERVD